VDPAAADEHLDLETAAVLVVGHQGRIEHWSRGATALFGYPADQMVGSKVTGLIPEQFRARHWEAWGRAWRANGFAQGAPIMIPVVCADGTVRPFVSHVLPVHAPHGELLAVTAVWAPPSDRDRGVRLLT
jgi:PAS domain S-box-containing protein